MQTEFAKNVKLLEKTRQFTKEKKNKLMRKIKPKKKMNFSCVLLGSVR